MSRGDSCLHGIDLILRPAKHEDAAQRAESNVCRIVGAAIAAEQFPYHRVAERR